jgi:hypothetical protein
LLERPEYRRVAERICSIVPKSSVVGMLLEHSEEYTVVDSDQLGFMQHDGFSWQVSGREFVKVAEASRELQTLEQELQQWLQERPPEQRRQFVEALFDVLGATGAVTLSDLRDGRLKDAVTMFRAGKDLDKETREGVTSFVALMFRGNLRLVVDDLREETEKKTEQLKENLRQALEETTRKTGETTEKLKESLRQVWEETEKKTEETVRRIGLKKDKKDN